MSHLAEIITWKAVGRIYVKMVIVFQFEDMADRDDLMGVEDTAKRDILSGSLH